MVKLARGIKRKIMVIKLDKITKYYKSNKTTITQAKKEEPKLVITYNTVGPISNLKQEKEEFLNNILIVQTSENPKPESNLANNTLSINQTNQTTTLSSENISQNIEKLSPVRETSPVSAKIENSEEKPKIDEFVPFKFGGGLGNSNS